jgi:hypothetical protein
MSLLIPIAITESVIQPSRRPRKDKFECNNEPFTDNLESIIMLIFYLEIDFIVREQIVSDAKLCNCIFILLLILYVLIVYFQPLQKLQNTWPWYY